MAVDQYAEQITLTPGTGIKLLPLGLSEDDAIRVAGAPIRVTTNGATRYLHYDPGMVLMFGKSKRLNSIDVRGDFPGKTSAGITLGDDKQAVGKAHGDPVQQADDFQQFNGLRVEYDEKGKVKSLSVFEKTQEQREPEKEQ